MKEPSWSRQVKIRDHYLCRDCGEGAFDHEILDADHIKPRRQFPELADTLDNGRTLCLFCHAKKHFKKGELRETVLILLRLLKILMRRTRWPKITRKDREAFRLVEMQGLKLKEAAVLMECSEQSISAHLNKIKKFYPHLWTEKGDFHILQLPNSAELFIKQRF